MRTESIIAVAGNAFKESKFGKDLNNRSCFIEAFLSGVRFFANHLYRKGSLFEIFKSIRQTNECDEWSPIENYEMTILRVLDDYRKHYTDIQKMKMMLKEKDEKIKELEDALSTIH